MNRERVPRAQVDVSAPRWWGSTLRLSVDGEHVRTRWALLEGSKRRKARRMLQAEVRRIKAAHGLPITPEDQ